jgi:hypothetical protein
VEAVRAAGDSLEVSVTGEAKVQAGADAASLEEPQRQLVLRLPRERGIP